MMHTHGYLNVLIMVMYSTLETSYMYNDTRFLSKTQLIMINQSNAGHFDSKVFVNCIQDTHSMQLTKTFGPKRPAFD